MYDDKKGNVLAVIAMWANHFKQWLHFLTCSEYYGPQRACSTL